MWLSFRSFTPIRQESLAQKPRSADTLGPSPPAHISLVASFPQQAPSSPLPPALPVPSRSIPSDGLNRSSGLSPQDLPHLRDTRTDNPWMHFANLHSLNPIKLTVGFASSLSEASEGSLHCQHLASGFPGRSAKESVSATLSLLMLMRTAARQELWEPRLGPWLH